MEEFSSWDNIYEATGIYYEIALAECYHVIFSHGTSIKIESQQIDDPKYHYDITPEHMETWPVERLGPDIDPDEVYSAISKVWKELLGSAATLQTANPNSANPHNQLCNVIKTAYWRLFSGVNIREFTTRGEITPVICLRGEFYILDFAQGLNIVPDGDLDEVVDEAITLRERDLLFPQIYAIITPESELIICTREI